MPIVPGVELLPLLPGQHHLLRRGRELAPGERVRRCSVTSTDGVREWDGTYEHQSSRGLVHGLLAKIKTQGVWDRERAWRELTDEQNVGGAWLRRQDDPRATFEELWATAYQHEPKLSLQQVTEVLLAAVEATPGMQLVYLRELAARHGWRNRGHVDDLLAGLVGNGTLREERTYGPSGRQCTSRRFWKIAVQSVAVVARTTAVTVSLALLAVGSTGQAKGHRSPEGTLSTSLPGRESSYLRLLTERELKTRGLKILWERVARRRQAARSWVARRSASRRPAPPPPVEVDEELQALLADTPDLTGSGPPAVPAHRLGWVDRCLL